MAILFAIIACGSVRGLSDSVPSLSPHNVCGPKVKVWLDSTVIDVCLDQFKAGGDSCTDFVMRLQKPYFVDIRFKCSFNHGWSFDSMVSPEPLEGLPPLHVDISIDNAGHLFGMRVLFGSAGDSEKIVRNFRKNDDMQGALPYMPPAPVQYVLLKTAYRCVDRPVYGVVVQRTFTYPPGFMHREPVYNYPELSMFHYGRAVRMPSAHSLDERADLINNGHILHPPLLKYNEEPLHYIEDGKMKKPASKNEGFIKIKPLRNAVHVGS